MEVKEWKKILHANANANVKKDGLAILVLDKIQFKTDYKKHKELALHNDTGVNPRRGYNIPIYVPNMEQLNIESKY